MGVKVSQERKFKRTKVLGTFATEERKFHWCESYKERKFLYFSLECSTVPRHESSSRAKVLSVDFSQACTQGTASVRGNTFDN